MSPFACSLVVSFFVSEVQLRNFRHQGVFWVWIGQQRQNREKQLANSKRRAPLVVQNVQADFSLATDVAVINLGHKVNHRGPERVVRGEGYFELELTAFVGGIFLANDVRFPVK